MLWIVIKLIMTLIENMYFLGTVNKYNEIIGIVQVFYQLPANPLAYTGNCLSLYG